MGQQRIGKVVGPLVGVGVRVGGGPQQREPQHAVVDIIAVAAVIQQRRAVARLGQVGPLMGADLEAGLVPAGVGVGIPGNAAELDVILGAVGADIHRESSFQQHMLLVPVDVGGKVDAAAVGVEGDILHELRPGNGAFQMQAAADRAVLGHSQASRTVQRKAVAAVVFFQVPGVVLVGAVLKQLQLVGALPGRDQLAAGLFVQQGGDLAAAVEYDVIERRVNDIAAVVFGDFGAGGLWFCVGKGVEPPALGGQVLGNKGQHAVFGMAGQRVSAVCDAACPAGDADDGVPGKAQLVKHDHAGTVGLDEGRDGVQRVIGDSGIGREDLAVLLLRDFVYLAQGRTG